jgi:hypothetical protein
MPSTRPMRAIAIKIMNPIVTSSIAVSIHPATPAKTIRALSQYIQTHDADSYANGPFGISC